jgi:hypothetical protein
LILRSGFIGSHGVRAVALFHGRLARGGPRAHDRPAFDQPSAMNRPRHVLARLLLAAAFAAGTAHAQEPAVHAGDAWLDARLIDIGTYAATYHDAFVDEVVRYRRAPRDLVEELLARPGWTPGDVYFACSLALQAGRPCRAVADLRQAGPSRDWGSIARDLGVAPGTAGYVELKRGIVASYQHWARPVPADVESRAGKGSPASTAASSQAPALGDLSHRRKP